MKIIPVLTIGLLGLAILFYFAWRMFLAGRRRWKAEKEALGKLANDLNGTMSKSKWNRCLNGAFQGSNISINIPSGSEEAPYLVISIHKNALFRLIVTKNTAYNKYVSWGNRHFILLRFTAFKGMVHGVTTQDEMFDKAFLITTDQPQRALNYLSNSTVKATIKELVNTERGAFQIDGSKVIIYKPWKGVDDLEPQRVITALEKLSILAEGI